MSMTGADAEDAALAHLRTAGLRLVERNFRCRFGELDLVMMDGATLVFVEVRLRTGSLFGGAAESITHKKQQRVVSAARLYLSARGNPPPPCRFDVVLLRSGTEIEWIRDAFQE